MLLNSCQLDTSSKMQPLVEKNISNPIKIFNQVNESPLQLDTSPNTVTKSNSKKKRTNSLDHTLDLQNTSINSLKFTHYIPTNNVSFKKVN